MRIARAALDVLDFAWFLLLEWRRIRRMTDLIFEYELERRFAAVAWMDEGSVAH